MKPLTFLELNNFCHVDEDIFPIQKDFLTFVLFHDLSDEGLATTIKETLKKIGFGSNKM